MPDHEQTIDELDAEIAALKKRRELISRLPEVTPDMLTAGYAVLSQDGDGALGKAFIAMVKASPYLMDLFGTRSQVWPPATAGFEQGTRAPAANVVRTWIPEFMMDDEPLPPSRATPEDWLVNEGGMLTVGGSGVEAIPAKIDGTFAFLGFRDGRPDDFAVQFKLTVIAGVPKFVAYVAEPIVFVEPDETQGGKRQ